MSKWFYKIENWLLIVPILLIIVEKLIFNSAAIDIHLHDTYFVVSRVYIAYFILIIAFIPYGCHAALRIKKAGYKKLLLWQVVITLLLMLFFYMPFFFINDATGKILPRRYFDFSNWESLQLIPGAAFSYFCVITFILLQYSLIAFTLTKLIINRYKY